MPAPEGLGIWIAFAGAVGGHEHIADVLPALGAKWVAPRGGESRTRDPQWTVPKATAAIQRYHAAGLRVYPWLFSRPWSYPNEIEIFKAFVDEGADGFIIDAEFAWDFMQRGAAARYMDALDRALPTAWIADAPWAYPGFHPGFPFVEFGRRMNARMPQCYWTEFSNQGAQFHLPRIDDQWRAFHNAHPEVVRPVMPIGVAYGHEHPSHPPGNLALDDLGFFLDRYAGGVSSLYSYEAMRASTRAFLEMRVKAAAPAERGPTDPGLILNDDGPATPLRAGEGEYSPK